MEGLKTLFEPVTEDIKKLEAKVNTLSLSSLSSPKSLRDSPFMPRSANVFDKLKESSEGGLALSAWADDSNSDMGDQDNARYHLLTETYRCRHKVKTACLVEGIKRPDVRWRAEGCLKRAKLFHDFSDQLQLLYPGIRMVLSIRGKLAKIGHLPADLKTEQIEHPLNKLEKVFDKFTPNTLSDEQKVLEPVSRINDKTFMKTAQDPTPASKLDQYRGLSEKMRELASFSVSVKYLQAS